ELTLKLPHYNRGNPVKVILNSSAPPVLEQVQTARNYLILALEAYEASPHAGNDRDSLKKLLDRISNFIKKAKAVLQSIHETDTFPAKECNAKAFSPDLPEDLIVEFHVVQSSLVVSVFAVNYHQPGIPLQFQSKILGKFKNMKMDTYKGKPVEVLDELTVESPSPRLATLVRAIDTVNGLCEELRMKIQIFR
ncbi:RAVE subunit 2/Rogdi, partial [Phlyctochytrium arcticum]